MKPVIQISLSRLFFIALLGAANGAMACWLDWEAASGLTPDQVGYERVDTSSPEDPVLSSTALTLGNDVASEVMYYRMTEPNLIFPETIEVSFRMRFVSGESTAVGRAPVGVFVTTAPNVGSILYIGKDEMFLASGSTASRGPQNTSLDTDGAFHDYVFRIEGTAVGSQVSVYQDGQLVLSGASFESAASHGGVRRIAFGQISGLAYGTSEWQSFSQNASILSNPPTADASATMSLVLSPNNTNATVVLDGSLSSDPEGDPLSYRWLDQSDVLLATGVVAVATLPVGTNLVSLVVSDGVACDTHTIAVVVITLSDAADRLLRAVGDSGSGNGQGVVASLRAALASIDRSHPVSAIHQLQAFQNQVQARVAPEDPALADEFIQQAQEIIDSLLRGELGSSSLRALVDRQTGNVRLEFSGFAGAMYLIEASDDMVHWQRIGVARDRGNGRFDFEDPDVGRLVRRFYRALMP